MKFPCNDCLVAGICKKHCEKLFQYVLKLDSEKDKIRKIKCDIPITELTAFRLGWIPSNELSFEICRLIRDHFIEGNLPLEDTIF